MIEYYETWAVWDTTTIVLTYLISVYGYWFVNGHRTGKLKVELDEDTELEETLKYIKSPFWVFLAVAAVSFFAVGLYALVPIGLYCLTVGWWKIR